MQRFFCGAISCGLLFAREGGLAGTGAGGSRGGISGSTWVENGTLCPFGILFKFCSLFCVKLHNWPHDRDWPQIGQK